MTEIWLFYIICELFMWIYTVNCVYLDAARTIMRLVVGECERKLKKCGLWPAISLIDLFWKRQEGKSKICSRKNGVREITNCLHILWNEPYFQLLLFIISDLRKCPCPIRASRQKWKCPIRATFCPIRASRFGVNRPNFAKRNNTSRGEVRKKWEADWKITRQLHDYYI